MAFQLPSSAVFIWRRITTTKFQASAMIRILLLALILIRTSAEEIHSSDSTSHCNYECIVQDKNCEILNEQMPQDENNTCIHSMVINFLSTGSLNVGSLALQIIDDHVMKIKQTVQGSESSNDSILCAYQIRMSLGAQWLLCLQRMLSDLVKLAKNDVMLKSIETNWTYLQKAYEESRHPIPAYMLAMTTEEYISALQVGLSSISNISSSYNFIKLLVYPYINQLLNSNEIKEHMLTVANTIKTEFNIFVKTADAIDSYVNPVLFVPIFILGLVLNGTLLVICIRHKELRTPPNIMLFNLAVADILNVIINIPLAHLFEPNRFLLEKSTCQMYLIVRHMSIFVSAISVVAISWQRYMAVVNFFQVTSTFTVVIYILIVWLIAFGNGLLNSLIINDPCYTQALLDNGSKILDLNNFLLYCIFLPGFMVIFSVLTAIKLNSSAKTIPGAHSNQKMEFARYRSARVITSLAIVFAVSNIPLSLRFFLHTWFSIQPNSPTTTVILDTFFYFLLFSNAWFNPVALYVASKLFRGYFQHYLFCHSLSSEQTQKSPKVTKSDTEELAIIQLNA